MTIQPVYHFDKVYEGTAEELQEELNVLTLENIKRYPEYKSLWDDFYSMWLRFGPDSARTIMIPYIWQGKVPSPKETVVGRKG